MGGAGYIYDICSSLKSNDFARLLKLTLTRICWGECFQVSMLVKQTHTEKSVTYS